MVDGRWIGWGAWPEVLLEGLLKVWWKGLLDGAGMIGGCLGFACMYDIKGPYE